MGNGKAADANSAVKKAYARAQVRAAPGSLTQQSPEVHAPCVAPCVAAPYSFHAPRPQPLKRSQALKPAVRARSAR